jgi:hypothetical protein
MDALQALIIHSPDDPLKRGVDFDEEQVLVIADWYHDTSAVITEALLSSSGYQGVSHSIGSLYAPY